MPDPYAGARREPVETRTSRPSTSRTVSLALRRANHLLELAVRTGPTPNLVIRARDALAEAAQAEKAEPDYANHRIREEHRPLAREARRNLERIGHRHPTLRHLTTP